MKVVVSNWLYIGVDESMLPLSSVSCCFAVKSSDLVFFAPSNGAMGLSEPGPRCSKSLLHGFASRLHSCLIATYPRSCWKEILEEKEYEEFIIAFTKLFRIFAEVATLHNCIAYFAIPMIIICEYRI